MAMMNLDIRLTADHCWSCWWH